MDELIREIEKVVEKKYNEIKETGKIYSGIKKFTAELAWFEPELARYAKRKMLEIAEKRGDLP